MAAIRELVRQRASGRCEYCRLPDSADEWPFHVDHIVARQHEGSDEVDNLCWACSRCNLSKGTNLTTIEAGQPVVLFRPRVDRWEEHFRAEGGRITGLTPTGRATVRLLAMNSSARIELRQRLAALGDW
jgi:5-methylcytosine-specific restriction endonuclease McrA